MRTRTFLLILALVVASCSPADDEKEVSDQTYAPGFIPGGGGGKRRNTASIDISVGPRTSSFALANATNFSILLEGCLTGWTTTATAANPSLDVYIDDRGCLAKLMEFEWETKTYVPKAGADFSNWTVGDTATFEDDNNASDTMEVRVVSTLDDPVSGTEAITYQFYELANGGSGTVLDDDVGDPHALTVGGQSAPAFTIFSITYGGTTITGGGKFTIVLECDEDIVASACKENAMANITYKLVEDSYSSAPTLTDARTLFGTAGQTIADPADIIAVSGGGTTHGGFTTIELSGPDAMHDHPNMMLFLRVDGGADADVNNDSFTYFNIDVEILTYP